MLLCPRSLVITKVVQCATAENICSKVVQILVIWSHGYTIAHQCYKKVRTWNIECYVTYLQVTPYYEEAIHNFSNALGKEHCLFGYSVQQETEKHAS